MVMEVFGLWGNWCQPMHATDERLHTEGLQKMVDDWHEEK